MTLKATKANFDVNTAMNFDDSFKSSLTPTDNYGYTVEPVKSSSPFTKFTANIPNVLRFITRPVKSIVHWVPGKGTITCSNDSTCLACSSTDASISKKNDRWTLGVFNHTTDQTEIYQFGREVHKKVAAIVGAWGDPTAYDLKITQTNAGRVGYDVVNLPNKPLSTTAQKEVNAFDSDLSIHTSPTSADKAKEKLGL